jgi:acyl CoA:acetate/3-ketoacid CoA transferase beta subunit
MENVTKLASKDTELTPLRTHVDRVNRCVTVLVTFLVLELVISIVSLVLVSTKQHVTVENVRERV